MKHLRTFWFTSKSTFGIVVGDDDVTGKRKAYIGCASGLDEEADEKDIMQWGSPVNVALLEEVVALMKGRRGTSETDNKEEGL